MKRYFPCVSGRCKENLSLFFPELYWKVNCAFIWLGGFANPGGKVGDDPGIRVRVQGLNHDVMQEDIDELFSGVGELIRCEVCSKCNQPFRYSILSPHTNLYKDYIVFGRASDLSPGVIIVCPFKRHYCSPVWM